MYFLTIICILDIGLYVYTYNIIYTVKLCRFVKEVILNNSLFSLHKIAHQILILSFFYGWVKGGGGVTGSFVLSKKYGGVFLEIVAGK